VADFSVFGALDHHACWGEADFEAFGLLPQQAPAAVKIGVNLVSHAGL
jgi:hypothetical protein